MSLGPAYSVTNARPSAEAVVRVQHRRVLVGLHAQLQVVGRAGHAAELAQGRIGPAGAFALHGLDQRGVLAVHVVVGQLAADVDDFVRVGQRQAFVVQRVGCVHVIVSCRSLRGREGVARSDDCARTAPRYWRQTALPEHWRRQVEEALAEVREELVKAWPNGKDEAAMAGSRERLKALLARTGTVVLQRLYPQAGEALKPH